ncbi:uncharacterized protein LOC133785898 [Humulus lupulus]|uniref:uncharacterized protein LOC133785898 n=1 Tax=Humulus lupulus TaxID=3486 RepID=UPI002B40F2EB|nr:uncharacterized protein LOC133785898 [Humulus lupulus]
MAVFQYCHSQLPLSACRLWEPCLLRRVGVDKTLFIKNVDSDTVIAQIYADDIIYGSPSNSQVHEFVKRMKDEFEMSMVGDELNYFSWFASQTVRRWNLHISRESHVTTVKRIIRYVNCMLEYGIRYSKEIDFNLVCFSDDGWADNADEMKSISGGCFYLENNFVSWHNKKQKSISLSTAEAEYMDETNNG